MKVFSNCLQWICITCIIKENLKHECFLNLKNINLSISAGTQTVSVLGIGWKARKNSIILGGRLE